METEPQLYLIAHKVRGEPAFDIATRMKCPICEPIRQGLDDGTAYSGCHECNDEQFWWIIPTSGHRAYPSDYIKLSHLATVDGECPLDHMALPTDSLPDHYETTADKGRGLIKDLAAVLGLPRPNTTIVTRRI